MTPWIDNSILQSIRDGSFEFRMVNRNDDYI